MKNTDFDWFDEESSGDWSDVDNMLADEREKHDNAIYNQALNDAFNKLEKYEDEDGWLRLKMSSIFCILGLDK